MKISPSPSRSDPEADAPLFICALAVWVGLLAGLVEVVIVSVRKLYFHELIWRSADFVWEVPLTYTLLLLAPGIVLTALARWRPGLISRRTVIMLVALLGFSLCLANFARLALPAAELLAVGLAWQTATLATTHSRALGALMRRSLGWPARMLAVVRRHGAAPPDVAMSQPIPTRREFLIGAGATLAGLAISVQGVERLTEARAAAGIGSPTPGSPNVLLIVMDTVRAASVSAYGHERPTTPFLTEYAKTGILFERTLSTAPWTLPSHASLFTGHFPYDQSTGWLSPLDARQPTLAEVLTANGYATAGFVGNTKYCSREFGLGRGFVHYEDFSVSVDGMISATSFARKALGEQDTPIRKAIGFDELLDRQSAAALNHAFLAWLSGQGSRPFFAFLNYFDAHDPYSTTEDLALRFTGSGRPANHYDFTTASPGLPPVAEELGRTYEASIAYMDQQLKELLRTLDQRGILEHTLVVITSDHGELFGEHELMEHGHAVYLPAIQVPLVITLPGTVPDGLRASVPVSLRDFPATILDVAGLSQRAALPGSSLARFWSSSAKGGEQAILTEMGQALTPGGIYPPWYPAAKGPLRSLLLDDLHFIRDFGDGHEELYSLRDDPTELNNLAGSPSTRAEVDRFRELLDALPPPRA